MNDEEIHRLRSRGVPNAGPLWSWGAPPSDTWTVFTNLEAPRTHCFGGGALNGDFNIDVTDQIIGHWRQNSISSPSPLPGGRGRSVAENSNLLIKTWFFW